MRKTILLVMLCLGLGGVAAAQTAPAATDTKALAWSRLQIAAGLNYEWLAVPGDGSLPGELQPSEWTAGGYAAYNLVPQLDLIGYSKLGLTSHLLNSAVGLRLLLWQGK